MRCRSRRGGHFRNALSQAIKRQESLPSGETKGLFLVAVSDLTRRTKRRGRRDRRNQPSPTQDSGRDVMRCLIFKTSANDTKDLGIPPMSWNQTTDSPGNARERESRRAFVFSSRIGHLGCHDLNPTGRRHTRTDRPFTTQRPRSAPL